ncbi:hypothetical protein HY478_00585 [Candidatus Uhrbacteria bacterium]|nr:hypothetical protein [Candidatus Uhrbacteria bacterium]
MPTLVTWGDVVQSSFQSLWLGFSGFFPKFLGAVVIFLVGVLVAAALRSLIVRLAGLLRLDALAEKLELKGSLAKVGITLKIGELIGWLVKWFVMIAALIAATDILDWPQITDFLRQVVFYIPNVVIAVVILLAGILLANFVRNVVHQTVKAGGLVSADFLAGISRWSILLFTFMAALVQLRIAPELIQMLFAGLVAMLALAAGLAFGLGGKDAAGRFIDRLRKEISADHR